MPDAETQTDECVDVISRMNKELRTVQERCQEAERRVRDFIVLPATVATTLVHKAFLSDDPEYSVSRDEWKNELFSQLVEMCGLDSHKRKREDEDV